MNRHAMFVATALAIASIGTAVAATQSAPAPRTQAIQSSGNGDASERLQRHGKGHRGHHRGHGGIERLDKDGDGRVSRAEFDAGQAEREARMARFRKPAGDGDAKRPQRKALDFAAVDANKDGYIVRSELRAHHERMRPQLEAERAKRFAASFAAADLNRDGKLSRIEVDEKMSRLGKRFAWMDDNRYGFLDKAELQAGKRR